MPGKLNFSQRDSMLAFGIGRGLLETRRRGASQKNLDVDFKGLQCNSFLIKDICIKIINVINDNTIDQAIVNS